MTTNWAGNVVFSAARTVSPTSVAGLRSLVASESRVRAVGAGHSFSRIADTSGTLLSLHRMPETFSVRGSTVRVDAGMRLATLASRLHAHGLALHAMPSLPHLTVAGAIATATHGSGDTSGSLASAVRSLELVTADGTLITVPQEDLPGAVVSLGALGVVTHVSLAVVPTYEVAQTVWEGVPFPTLVSHLDEIFASAYSVSAFVHWPDTATLWVKARSAPPNLGWTGAVRASGSRHPVPGQPAAHCTQQEGVPGPWHERLPHFRADFTPSVGAELQSEYFVPRGTNALEALVPLSPYITPLLHACELRTVAAEDHWLSPAFGRDSLAIHFTWTDDVAAVRALLPRIEEALEPRPHWGKLFEIPPHELATRYPHWDRFAVLHERYDPAGKFRNAVIDRLFP